MDFTSPATRVRLNRCAAEALEGDDKRHFYRCPGCRQHVDYREWGDVLHHEEPGHHPLLI